MRKSFLHTENAVAIAAPADSVYGLAADIERWPEILSHYQAVRLSDISALQRTAYMSVRHLALTIGWTSIQTLDPDARSIGYHHIRGITREMDVEWRIEEVGDTSFVTITHHLDHPEGMLRVSAVRHVAGRVFIAQIADRTLAGIKRAAESPTVEW